MDWLGKDRLGKDRQGKVLTTRERTSDTMSLGPWGDRRKGFQMGAHNVLQQLFLDGTPYTAADSGDAGTLTADRQLCLFKITTSTAETRTLAQPVKPNIMCMVCLDADGGDLTLTVTGGYNAEADTSLTFGDAGDWVLFISVEVGSSFYWRIVASGGVNPAIRTTDGIGAKNGTTVAAAEYGDGIVHKTVLTLTNCAVEMFDEEGVVAWGGTKIYDFPAGAIQILGAVVDMSATVSGNGINADFDGDCALGTTIATNANNALAGTEADILASFATNQAADSVAAVEGQGCSVVAASLNGVATAKDMYLNMLVDDADHDIVNGDNNVYLLCSGTVTVHWINLGDIA